MLYGDDDEYYDGIYYDGVYCRCPMVGESVMSDDARRMERIRKCRFETDLSRAATRKTTVFKTASSGRPHTFHRLSPWFFQMEIGHENPD
jgi:hypothetical protein